MVLEEMQKKNIKLNDEAVDTLSEIMHELCGDIIIGADKVAKYSNKESVDSDAIKIAAYVDSKLKDLEVLKRF